MTLIRVSIILKEGVSKRRVLNRNFLSWSRLKLSLMYPNDLPIHCNQHLLFTALMVVFIDGL